jgi:hypothetical protein
VVISSNLLLPDDGLVRLKHVAKSDILNDILRTLNVIKWLYTYFIQSSCNTSLKIKKFHSLITE